MESGASTVWFEVISIGGAVISSTAFLTWFISDQLARNRRLFYRVISRHNREDDDRFALMQESLYQIHLRNAMRDGDEPPRRKEIPRRRYLINEAGEDDGDLE